MARQINVSYTDDLDGSPIDVNGLYLGTEFSVNGQTYRLDLCEENYDRFHQALLPYIDVAEKVKTSPIPNKTTISPSGTTTSAVRDWARRNGYDVSHRGRIAAPILKAFTEANS